MSTKEEFKMSQARFDALQKELNYLKTTRSDEVAEMIKGARGFGDLSENSEYDEAKNEQGKLFSRIAEIEAVLSNFVLIDEQQFDANAVSMGSQVTVKDAKSGKEATYRIVCSQEADPMQGRISEDSPFGKALLGKAVGDKVEVEAPIGLLYYTVVNIQKG